MAKKQPYTITCKGCGATHTFKVVDGEVKHVYKPKVGDDDPKGKKDTGSRHANDDDPNTRSSFENFLSGTGKFADPDENQTGKDDDPTDDDEDE